MFTYHAAKNSANTVSALGSVAVEANARVSLYLRKLEGSDDRIFDTMQNSGKRFGSIGLSDPKEGFITATGTLTEIEFKACCTLIREFIEANPGIVEKEILETIERRRRTVVLALRQMIDSRELERIRDGNGGARDPWHYYIAGSPEKRAKIIDLFSQPKD
jgi:hypothetical protein